MITDIKQLEVNKVYTLTSTQFNRTFKTRCLGNYGVGNKVYFTMHGNINAETPKSLAYKFKNNILPNSFVCWDCDINSWYIIK